MGRNTSAVATKIKRSLLNKIYFFLLVAVASPAFAAVGNGVVFVQPVPTLDEIGLGSMVALVAGAAGWMLRRRRKKDETRSHQDKQDKPD
jgi:hypothetical protein